MKHHLVFLASLLLFLAAPSSREARAQDTGSSSGPSSNDSSANSNDSSAGSNESSADTDQSSQNSNDSTDATNSSENSSQDTGQGIGRAAVGTVVVGAALLTTGGGIATTVMLAGANQGSRVHPVQIAAYLRKHHGLLVHDVAVGEGPAFTSLLAGAGLTPEEIAQVIHNLDGSSAQREMLHALDGPIGEDQALQFAAAYYEAVRGSLPESRLRELLASAEP